MPGKVEAAYVTAFGDLKKTVEQAALSTAGTSPAGPVEEDLQGRWDLAFLSWS
jgi:hypothetical protein